MTINYLLKIKVYFCLRRATICFNSLFYYPIYRKLVLCSAAVVVIVVCHLDAQTLIWFNTKGYVTPEKQGEVYNGRTAISASDNRWQHHPSPQF